MERAGKDSTPFLFYIAQLYFQNLPLGVTATKQLCRDRKKLHFKGKELRHHQPDMVVKDGILVMVRIRDSAWADKRFRALA